MNTVWRWGSRLLTAALALYVIVFAAGTLQLQTIKDALSNIHILIGTLAATLCYTLIYPLTGWAWHKLLLRQEEQYSAITLTRIIGLTQIAKYIPGNIAQHVSRAALSLKIGITPKSYIASAGQEAILTVGASLCIGTVALAASQSGMNLLRTQGYSAPFYMLTGASLIGTMLLCIDLPAKSLCRSNRWSVRMLGKMGGLPGPATALTALAAYATNFFAVGIGIWLLSRTLGLDEEIDLPLATAAFALSWTLGFLAPGAPAGLGAREGIMLLILEGHGNHEQILLLVLLTRTSSMVGDLAVFLLSLVTSRGQQSGVSIS
ncbi:Lysylphosphatidylglycerol synthase TM region [Xanthomonas sp. GW]|uniref:lysylphosphatidylglycerol synthase domain-containing protein n=1 Tax=Xanthomonas sp. GW TaxID=2724121 RepID=UPI0016395BBE|nr:lysylphosphatidylglycerol synthase domain-containing protein [Xanthomonas sp. GW]QNH20190.1 Lysylphosphatidylglycerol synthase TM region [Xanthomonas sp. GW]